MQKSAALTPGLELEGKYRVRTLLGGGAMGVVYEADHLLLQKQVAVKVLRPELAALDDLRDRFEAEARAAAALAHPNIVTVTDMGRTPDGALYFVMDRLRGETLGDRLERQGRLTIADMTGIALDVLAGLEAAHELGLVHRDLKPDNVFLAKVAGGRALAKILDFGVAKALASVGKRAHGTRMGLTVGTPLYMAPEQALGQADIDGRVDLYALGVILFQCLSGRPPYDASDAMAVIACALSGPAPRLGPLCPEAPPALCALVESALNRDRDARPATAAAFAERLRQAVAGAVPPSPSGGYAPVPPHSGGFPSFGPPLQESTPLSIPRGVLTSPVLADVSYSALVPNGVPAPAPVHTESAFQAPPIRTDGLELARRTPAPEPSDEPRRPWNARRTLSMVAVALLLPEAGLGALVIWPMVRGPAEDLVARARAAAPALPVPAATPAPREMLLVGFEVVPRSSRLFLDGEPLTSNPMRLGKGEMHTLSAVADGYELAEQRIFVDQAKTVSLRLKAAKRTRRQ